MDCYHILLDMHSHSREATGTVTPFDKYAESQSRSNCYPILLNTHCHSREATDTVTPFDNVAQSQSRCYPILLCRADSA